MFANDSFFDARDLVQVKYEMLRRVQSEGHSVTGAATGFRLLAALLLSSVGRLWEGGLAGLVPHKRGPKHAHKLTDEVLTFLIQTRQKEPSVPTSELARLIQKRFGTKVHPRSIERGLPRHKKTPLNQIRRPTIANPHLTEQYEQLRREATGCSEHAAQGLGLALFLRRGMTAWMQAWSQCADPGTPNTRPHPASMAPVPIDLRAQIATLLAGIILSLQQEATYDRNGS